MDFKKINLKNKKNIVRILDLIEQYLMQENFFALKRLSNELLEKAATSGNKNLIYLSYLPYMLYKVLTQQHIIKSKEWKNDKEIILNYIDNIEKTKNFDFLFYVYHLKNKFKKQDYELYRYLKNIFYKAKTKQAAKLIDLGFSVKKAISLTDADLFELNQYIRSTKTHHHIIFKENISKKVEHLENNKNIVFDSSTLISLGNSCLYGTLVILKEKGFNFYITPNVKDEVISIGKKIPRFEWNAKRIERLLNNNILILKEIKNKELYKNLESHVNQLFKTNHGYLEILQRGELEAMVLSQELNALFAVDELPTRLLIEKPREITKIMNKRYKTEINYNKHKLIKYFDIVKNIKVIRSVDIISYAYKLNIYKNYSNNILRAMLYSLKYNGCATTIEEINNYINKEGLNE